MANETTVQTSCIQENRKADECCENIPPGVTAAAGISKLKFQVGDVEGYSSAQPSGGNKPDNCTFSTPAPTGSNGGVKAKSRISGFQSALTPILKYLNIGNKCPSPEPLKHGNSPHLSVPFFPFSCTTANGKKSAGGSSQHPNSDFSSSHSGQSLGDTNAPVSWLHDEYLPEITLLDDTCDSTMQLTRNDSPLPGRVPATPITAGFVNSTYNALHPPEVSKYNRSTASTDPNAKMVDPPESKDASVRWLDDRYFPEITLLHVTHDSEMLPGGEISSMEVTQDILPVDSLQNNMPPSELSGEIVAEPDRLDMIQSEELSGTLDGNVTHTVSSFSEQSDKSVGENVVKAPLEVTQDISMGSVLENSRPSLEHSGQNMVKIQTSAEDSLDTHPVNLTRDINSSGDMSVQCAASQLSTSDIQCNTSSKNVTTELHGEPVVTSHTVGANNEELLTSHDAELTSKVPQPSPNTAGSVNSTFTIVQPSNLSASAAQISCPQNKTLELPPSNINSTQVESDATDQATSVSKNTTETSSVMNQNSSAVKANGSCDRQNATFDRHSLQKSSGNTSLMEVGAATFCLQNNTFETKSPSKQNGTITLSETSSSDSHQNTLDKTSPPKVCNATSSPKDNSEVHPTDLSERNGATASTDPDAKTGAATFCLQNNTFETKPPSKQNGTITLLETSSSGSHQNTLDKTSPPKVCNATSSPKDNSEVHPTDLSKRNGATTRTDPDAKTGAATFCLQNNTFETKPPSKQNGTITLSETSSSDSHQNTLDKPSPSKVCNATSSPKDNSEVHPTDLSKHNGTAASTDHDAKTADTPESTFEAKPAVGVASGAGRHETKDHSQSGLPMTDGLSDNWGRQSVDTENNKADTFNLDDTLDLRADSLITSTPMTSCKMFNLNTERNDGKTIGAQKKLYGDGPTKPDGLVPSDVPSNIVCDRKTFLTQPAAKSFLPPLKAASQLLKYKPASTLPGRFELLTSGLPMTRQRTQAEALRNTADAPQTTGISNSYNLRATTTGSKQPNSGLRKPQLSGIPSGIQRAAPGLRPPSARSTAPSSSSTDQLRGPPATNPVTKISQAKKHPLSRSEALPVAKKKKIDALLPSDSAEASTSSCDAANRAKNLKPPTTSQRSLPAKTQRDDAVVPASTAETSTSCNAASRARALKQPVTSHRALLPKPQGHGCAKCVELEQQLKSQSEEIRRLKAELLKYSTPEEDADY